MIAYCEIKCHLRACALDICEKARLLVCGQFICQSGGVGSRDYGSQQAGDRRGESHLC
jgi:hypothetical protein